jgi:hypothetical protein
MSVAWSEFKSKPITRLAWCIPQDAFLSYTPERSECVAVSALGSVTFKCYEQPKVGDYVCYLKADDVYHCSAAVFAERNVI